MRTRREVLEKRKKLRKRLHKAVFDYGNQQITDNCKFWVSDISGNSKCVYNCVTNHEEASLRDCPCADKCLDFSNKYTPELLEEKYLKMADDNVYLARNYRDLFILNWVLEESEPDWVEKLILKIDAVILKIKGFMLDGKK